MATLIKGPTDVFVALIGFRQPLPKNAVGIFRRCGLSLIASDDIEHVGRIMQTLALDALVVDSHSRRVGEIHAVLRQLLQLRHDTCRPGPLPSVVVLTSHNCTPSVRSILNEASAVQLPTSRQTFRELARLLRKLTGLRDPCCEPTEQSTL